jgi:hypothetical protein
MPTNSTDTDSFVANVQRPNNGELADSASLAQGFNPLTQRTRHLYNRTRTRIYDVTRAPYSSDSTGAADSSAAWQAALDAAKAAGGGTVVVPGGSYRFNSGLVIPRNVDLEATSHAILRINHATADFLTFETGVGVNGGVQRISGFTFGGLLTNTGTVIKDPLAASYWRHLIEDCSFNFSGSELQGPLIEQLGATEMTLERCYLAGKSASAVHVVRQAHPSAFMHVNRCRLVAPDNATWAARLLEAAGVRGVVSGSWFDLSPLLTTTGVGFRLAAASQPWRVVANEFIAPAGGYAVQGMSWATLAQLVESGNIFNGATMRAGAYPSSSVVALNYGSRLESLGHYRAAFGAVSPIDIPYGYRSIVIACGATSGPALVMPTGYHDGQELLLTYYNSSVSSVLISFATTPVTGTTVPTINPGNTLTGHFVWEDRSGTGYPDRWIQKGAWGVGTTLV